MNSLHFFFNAWLGKILEKKWKGKGDEQRSLKDAWEKRIPGRNNSYVN